MSERLAEQLARLEEHQAKLLDVISSQQDSLLALAEQNLDTLQRLADVEANLGITSSLLAAVLAEVANGDRLRLDEMLARMLSAAETGDVTSPHAVEVVLPMLDSFREAAERFFLSSNPVVRWPEATK